MTHYQTEKFCNDPQTSTITIKSSRNNSLLPRKTLQLLKTTHYRHQIINYPPPTIKFALDPTTTHSHALTPEKINLLPLRIIPGWSQWPLILLDMQPEPLPVKSGALPKFRSSTNDIHTRYLTYYPHTKLSTPPQL